MKRKIDRAETDLIDFYKWAQHQQKTLCFLYAAMESQAPKEIQMLSLNSFLLTAYLSNLDEDPDKLVNTVREQLQKESLRVERVEKRENKGWEVEVYSSGAALFFDGSCIYGKPTFSPIECWRLS